MTDVFISYSRKDTEFVRWLHDTLRQQQRDVWVDFEDIPRGADWLHVIYEAIEAANAFVLVVSPDSMISEIVNQEIAHAIELNKRMIPLIHRDVNPRELVSEWFEKSWEDDARNNWNAIRHINWLFFRDNDDLQNELEELLEIIDVDLAYVQHHTRLLVRAKDWESSGRDSSFLLSGTEMYDAATWLQSSENKKPAPTALHQEFIKSSQQRQTGARRRLIVSLLIASALTIMLVASIVLGIRANNAADEAAAARSTAEIAATSLSTAANGLATQERQANENLLIANALSTEVAAQLDASQNTESRFLADMSNQRRDFGAVQDAILLAQQSLANDITHGENQTALINALSSPVQERFYFRHANPVNGAVWSENRREVLSWAGSAVHVWTLNQPESPIVLPHTNEVQMAAWDPDEQLVLTVENETLRVWDLDDTSEPLPLRHAAPVNNAVWHPEGRYILVTTFDFDILVWDIENPIAPIRLSHDDVVRGASWNRDGSKILSWSYDFTVRLWDFDPAADEQQATVFQHQFTVNGAVFSNDESRLLTWTDSGILRIWDVIEEETPQIEVFHDSIPMISAAFSQDEQRILTLLADNSVRIWNSDLSEAPRLLKNDRQQQMVLEVGWNHDESAVSVRYGDGLMRVWFPHPTSPAQDFIIDLDHDGRVAGAVWSTQTNRLLTWADDDRMRLWDVDSGRPPIMLGHEENVRGAVWDEADDRLLSWSDDVTARIWDLNNPRASLTLPDNPSIFDVRWSPANDQIALWGDDAIVRVWDTNRPGLPIQLDHTPDFFSGAVWNPNGDHLLTWVSASEICESCNHRAYVWDVNNPDNPTILNHTDFIEKGDWSASGDQLLTVNSLVVNLWAANNLTADPVVLRHDSFVVDARFSPDGQRLLTVSNNIVHIWDLSNGINDIPQTPQRYSRSDTLNAAVWSADSSHFMAWGFGFGTPQQPSLVQTSSEQSITAYVWDLNTPEASPQALRHENPINFASFSPVDANRVLVGTNGNIARIWTLDALDSPTSSTLRHNNFVSGAEWTLDGSRVLTYSEDGTVRLWASDAPDVAVILRHDSGVIGARWDSAGNRVLSWSLDGTARIWNVAGVSSSEMLGTPIRLVSPAPVWIAGWNPSETRVLTWAGDGTTRIWDTDLTQLLAIAADANTIRDLTTSEERQRFFLPTFEPTDIAATATATITALPSLTATPTPLPSLSDNIEFGEAVGGQIVRGGDRNLWTFEGRVNQIVTISMVDDDSGLDPFVSLIGPDGTTLIFNDDAFGSLNSLIDNFTLPVDGIYTIDAAAFSDSSGSYVLTLIDLEQMTPTPSPTIPPPRMAVLGDNTSEFVDSGELQNWLFEGEAGQTITIEALADDPINFNLPDDGGLNLYIELYNPDGAFLSAHDDIESIDGFVSDARLAALTLPDDGVYSIDVFSVFPGEGGAYTLRITEMQLPTITPSPTASPTP